MVPTHHLHSDVQELKHSVGALHDIVSHVSQRRCAPAQVDGSSGLAAALMMLVATLGALVCCCLRRGQRRLRCRIDACEVAQAQCTAQMQDQLDELRRYLCSPDAKGIAAQLDDVRARSSKLQDQVDEIRGDSITKIGKFFELLSSSSKGFAAQLDDVRTDASARSSKMQDQLDELREFVTNQDDVIQAGLMDRVISLARDVDVLKSKIVSINACQQMLAAGSEPAGRT
jgi:flagellar hook-associated protein FlgK